MILDTVLPTCNKQGEVDVDVMNHDVNNNKTWMVLYESASHDGDLRFQEKVAWKGSSEIEPVWVSKFEYNVNLCTEQHAHTNLLAHNQILYKIYARIYMVYILHKSIQFSTIYSCMISSVHTCLILNIVPKSYL